MVAGVVFSAFGVLLWKTNPPHLKHHSRIWPGPAPLELMDLSGLKQADFDFIQARHPALARTTWQDFVFFSVSSNRIDGSRSSFGAMGFVFDLRSDEQRKREQAVVAYPALDNSVEGRSNGRRASREENQNAGRPDEPDPSGPNSPNDKGSQP